MIRNWLFGWYIVEFEQGGSDRAEYGANLLKKIAGQLKLKGCSERSLALCCKFYLTYSGILQALPAKSSDNSIGLKEIQQTQPVTSCDVIANAPQTLRIFSATLAGSFSLGWTHYVALLTISNADERRFYEIEARENSWGARELERQIIQLNSANRSARLVPKAVNDFWGVSLRIAGTAGLMRSGNRGGCAKESQCFIVLAVLLL